MYKMWTVPTRMRKSAGSYSDMTLNSLIQVDAPARALGGLIGLAGSNPTAKDIRGMDKHPVRAIIPGLGAYRIAKRRRYLHDLIAKNSPHTSAGIQLSENLAPFLQVGAGTALGGSVGGGLGAVAVGGSAAAANAIGLLMAALTKQRSLEDQAKYENDKHTVLKNLLLPGRGIYNKYKGVGATARLKGKSGSELEAIRRRFSHV